MFNVGGGELLVIFVLALIVLGPDKLPGAARQAGKYLSDFRRISQGFQQELKDAIDLPELDDLRSTLTNPLSTFTSPSPAAGNGNGGSGSNGKGSDAAASGYGAGPTDATAAAGAAGTGAPVAKIDAPPARVAPGPAGPGRRTAAPQVTVEGPSGSFS